MTDDRRSDWEAIDDALSRIPGTVESRRHVPESPEWGHREMRETPWLSPRPRLGLALVLLSAGVVMGVLVWWWLG